MTENGEQGATAICTRAPGPGLVQRSVEALRLGEDGIDLLDELVGRQAAVGDAEVHRAARGDDPHAELACGLHLRLEDPLAAAGEDVVVVEHGRAARECELREPGAGRCVLGLRVDPGPDGIELAQPREEVGLLRASPRQRLVQVMVRVDEPGRDDRAAEIHALLVLRLRSGAGGGDHRVVDEHPALPVLRPRVVHRDDPAVRVERPHAGGRYRPAS